MNKTLIFFCISCCLLIFSIIVVNTGPIITGVVGGSWNYQNCKRYSDHRKHIDDERIISDKNIRDEFKKYLKQGQHLCERQKAMYGLEYASLVSDLFFGVLCSLLSLLHYFEIGKYCEKVTGIIGLACGIIGFILTLIYIIYSGYIFTNDGPGKRYNLYFSSNPNSSPISHYSYGSSSNIIKLNKERAFAEWKDNKYECLYYKKDDEDSFYAKYNDLGKKQYNYHKDFELADANSEYKKCRIGRITFSTSLTSSDEDEKIIEYCKNPLTSLDNKVGSVECKHMYYSGNSREDQISNKYEYDKWVTSIIFGCFIIALNLGLALFGFLLFSQSDGTSGHVAVK
jgi:hypothetical protein